MALFVTVVDPSGVQRGRIEPSACSAVLRDTAVGTWTMSIPDGGLVSRVGEGWGVVVTDDTGQVFAGAVTEHSTEVDGAFLSRTLTGVTDFHVLADRLTFPTPSLPASKQTDGYSQASGPAESVIRNLVNANAGPAALKARRTSLLVIPSTLGRGKHVKVNTRFKPLSEEVLTLARAGGIRVDVVRRAGKKHLEFFEPRDLTRQVRFGEHRGGLTDGSVAIQSPTATVAVVAGQGEGADRTVREYSTNTASGRRIEVFKDRRDTDDEETHAQAAEEYLGDGAASASASFTVAETPGLRFGVDYSLGDRVTVALGNMVTTEHVREAAITWDGFGRTVSLKLGDHGQQTIRLRLG